MRLALLTDVHCVAPGETLFGLDPLANLHAAIDAVNGRAGVDVVVVMGDLTHRGHPEAFAGVADALSRLTVPWIVMTGNHDTRANFRVALPGADCDPNGFVQGLHVHESASLVVLDTLDEDGGTSAGYLCADRLDFLAEMLAKTPKDRPLLMFQHHPPFDCGIPAMDRIKLRNPQEEWEVFARVRRPDYLFMGHVHRPISGLWRGIPYHIQRGLSHQVALDFAATDGILGTYEGADYALVDVGGSIVIHQHPVRLDEPTYNLHDPDAIARPRRE